MSTYTYEQIKNMEDEQLDNLNNEELLNIQNKLIAVSKEIKQIINNKINPENISDSFKKLSIK